MGNLCTSQAKQVSQPQKLADSTQKQKQFKSKVCTDEKQFKIIKQQVIPKIVKKCTNLGGKFDIKMIFRASENNYEANLFHLSTHGVKNSLLLVRTKQGCVFGGFAACQWQKQVMYKYQIDQNGSSFIFAINKQKCDQKQKQDKQPKNSPQKQKPSQKPSQKNITYTYTYKQYKITNKQKSIMNNLQNGPIFGQGHDIFISDKCNVNVSWCNLGKSYECPYPFGSVKANKLLAGQERFLVEEYQIWEIVVL